MEKKLITLRIDADVYKKFSKYAYERGFNVKRLAQRVMSYAVDNDFATTLIASFKNSPTVSCRPAPSLAAAIDRVAIKEEIAELTSAIEEEEKETETEIPDFDIDNFLETDNG